LEKHVRARYAFVIAFISLLVALAAGWFAETEYQAVVATTELVVPAVEIPADTVVSAEMFKTRSFPAPMADEDVYVTLEQVAGKITTATLEPDELVYHKQLVSVSAFRYTDDERLEIVSFPIKPEQAVGGQIKPGQHINIYRIVLQSPPNQTAMASPDPNAWLAEPGAAVQVLEPNVLVADVRSTQGSPIAAAPAVASPGSDLTSYQASQSSSAASSRPLTILTVAVPPEVAKDILRLVGESQIASRYLLWVSLSPLVGSK
jgi:hypothetical protein